MLWVMILLPAIAGGAALLFRSDKPRRAMLVLIALANLVLVGLAWMEKPGPLLAGWLDLDDLGLLFLSITSVLFLAASFYAVGYLNRETWGQRQDFEEEFIFANTREAAFIACLLFFLSAMTLTCASRHFGLLWVAMEATSLASAPLIYFHRHRRSIEATWKYLMICSVGLALALLGNFFLSVAANSGQGASLPLLLDDLLSHAGILNQTWLKAAFLFFLVGYGSKLGLAPMHTWLPDAHSEAPSVASALLSGALLNCAFLALLRVIQVCSAARLGPFAKDLMLGFGLLSMATAAIFIVRQRDFKRMLAYSSVEHMGILSVAVGLGGLGNFGALLHAVNHSFTKGMLFFLAGNILTVYKTKAIGQVGGLLKVMPVSGVLWMVGFLAIVGTPPFGLFMSELVILNAALQAGRFGVAAAYLLLLGIIFIGMATIVLKMSQGNPIEQSAMAVGDNIAIPGLAIKENYLSIIPPMALGALVLMLGLYLPPALKTSLEHAARTIMDY